MTNSNNLLVGRANSALERLKFETARELGVDLKQGYNGDISARDAGRVGGNMVKKLIEIAEQSLK